MAALEASLGVRLLIRDTRKLSVTDAGLLFAQHAQRILDEIQEAELAGLSSSRRCVAPSALIGRCPLV